jgi:high frequency lysogenization protein
MSFKQSEYDRVIALAAMIQVATLVQSIANTGQLNGADFETLMNSLLATDAASTQDVYGNIDNIHTGLSALNKLLTNKKTKEDITTLRLIVSLLNLEKKLVKHPEMMALISKEIDQIPNQIDYFGGINSSQVIARFADVYHQTISQLTPRIHVHGDPTFLQQADNVNRIRALLLTGIRAAILWRQKGGKRWHFLFQSNKLLAISTELRTQNQH